MRPDKVRFHLALLPVPPNIEPTIAQLAPATIALPISPEKRIPPSAITGIPRSFNAAAASAIAVICGTPTPGHNTRCTNRTWSDTYFTALASASAKAVAPSAVATLPRNDR